MGRREKKVNCFWLVTVVLEIGHRLLLLERDIVSYCWAAKCSVSIFFSPNHVPSANLGAHSQVRIRLQFALTWLSLDALCSVPLHPSAFCCAERVVLWERVEPLTQILNFSKLVLHSVSEVLNLLFDDHSFGEGLFYALLVHRLCHTIDESLFSVAKGMLVRVQSPGVVSLPLHSRRDVSVSFSIHGCRLGPLFVRATSWVEQILCILSYTRWHSEFELVRLGLGGQVVASHVALSQRFSH